MHHGSEKEFSNQKLLQKIAHSEKYSSDGGSLTTTTACLDRHSNRVSDFSSRTSTTTSTTQPPRVGLCTGYLCKHDPKRKIQAKWGMDGLCTSCFKAKFPEKHAEHLVARKKYYKECILCKETKEVIGTVCRSCRRARQCDLGNCTEVNLAADAPTCSECEQKAGPGAKQKKLAMWCPSHTTEEERGSGLCRKCFQNKERCHHCQQDCESPVRIYACSEKGCLVKFPLCAKCAQLTWGCQPLLCKTCWYEQGNICIFCNRLHCEHKVRFYRSCKTCHTHFFCSGCHSIPKNYAELDQCLYCEETALWCRACNSEENLATGLCDEHLKESPRTCQHCQSSFQPEEASALQIHACSEAGCSRLTCS